MPRNVGAPIANDASSHHRFFGGDDSAFDYIMKEVFYNLVFFINRYVHNVHAAEDVAIDAFLIISYIDIF